MTDHSDILLRNLIERVRADVNILIQLGHIRQHQATEFLNSLPDSSPTIVAPASRRLVSAPPQPAPKLVRAKALWSFNEQRAEPDLSFSAGDIVEVVSKNNDDWWTGRANGREGLFPSAYCEILEETVVAFPSVTVQPQVRAIPPAPTSGKKPYKPFGAAFHGRDLPPANTSTNSVGLQAADQEAKKSKMEGLKNTMAHSAAGGVGFGAGAAIGGGLVRAIF